MKKILIFLFLGMLFSVTVQAVDVGYSPDVGIEQGYTYAKMQTPIMPAVVMEFQFVVPLKGEYIWNILTSSAEIPGNCNITAYHNPDYGLLSANKNGNINLTAKIYLSNNSGSTTRHVFYV